MNPNQSQIIDTTNDVDLLRSVLLKVSDIGTKSKRMRRQQFLERLGFSRMPVNNNPRNGAIRQQLLDAITMRIRDLTEIIPDFDEPLTTSVTTPQIVPPRGTMEFIVFKGSEYNTLQAFGVFNKNEDFITFIQNQKSIVKTQPLNYSEPFEYQDLKNISDYKNLGKFAIRHFPNLYKAVLNNDYDRTLNELNNISSLNDYDENCYIQVKFDDMVNIPVNSQEKIVYETAHVIPKKIVQIPPNYKVNGFVKFLPFSNVDSLNVESGCVYKYASEKYKRFIKNPVMLTKFLPTNKSVDFEIIVKFCEHYDIPMLIYNIAGHTIYRADNNKKQNTERKPIFKCVLSNNHIYPITSNHLSPNLCQNILSEQDQIDNADLIKNSIIITKNNIQHANSGIISGEYKSIPIDFDTEYKTNFSYECDVNKILALSANHDIEKSIFEYDLKSAYYNAYKLIDPSDEIPIFSCLDNWVKFDRYKTTEFVDQSTAYYLISEQRAIALRKYGLQDNFLTNHTVKLFMEYGKLQFNDIEYVKIPTNTLKWSTVRRNIDRIESNFNETHKTKFSQEFSKFSGKFGTSYVKNHIKIEPLPASEGDILSDDYTFKQDHDDTNMGFYQFTSNHFMPINSLTIYNRIIEKCRTMMLENILEIEKNDNILPNKIKVDCIAYDREIHIPRYANITKLVLRSPLLPFKNKQNLDIKSELMCISSCATLKYHNGNDLIEKIKIACENFKNNVTYTGEGGSGKTYKVKNCHTFDNSATFTNVCARNMSDTTRTLHNLFKLSKTNDDGSKKNKDDSKKYGGSVHDSLRSLKNQTIWIDEFSMIPIPIWNYIYLASMNYGVKFIFTGDINQLPPLENGKLPFNDMDIFGSIQDLTNDKVNKRMDEDAVIFSRKILNTRHEELPNLFENIKTDDWLDCDRHLAFHRKARDEINKTILKHRGYIFKKHTDNNGKLIKLDISKNVIVRVDMKKKSRKLFKGDLWKFIGMNGGFYVMQNLVNPQKQFIQQFIIDDFEFCELGYCVTMCSSQGLTIDENLCIHEIDTCCIKYPEAVYTACTRVRKHSQLRFSTYQYNRFC